MPDFLEKLKKGMNMEETPEITSGDKEVFIEESAFKETPIEENEPRITLASSAKTPEPEVRKKKGKIKVKPSVNKSFSPTEKPDGKKLSLFEQEGELTVDVFETEKNIIIQSAIAGIDADQLEIYIEKDMVSIKGRRERQIEEEAENYFYQECYWGRFSREIILPVETDTSRAEAAIKNGILTITIPKISREKIKKLGIKNIE